MSTRPVSSPSLDSIDGGSADVPPSRRGGRGEQWLAALLERSNDIIFALDAHGGVRYETPAAQRILGGPPAAPGTDALERIHPEDLARVANTYATMLEHPGTPMQLEFRMRRRDGTYAYVESIAVNLLDDPVVKSIVMNVRDTTEHRMVDPLTGLASRMLLSERVEHLRSQRGATFALIAVRAERIAQITSTLSSSQLRQLLEKVTARLRMVASPDDIVGRLDKYTFGLLAHGVSDLDTAMPVIARIKRGYGAPFEIGAQSVVLEGRFGLALGPRPETSSDDFLRHAEMALDGANGGGVRVFRPSVLARAKSRASVEADLRQALNTDELVAFYQPIVRTQTGVIEGFEALVRWRKPDGSLIAPLAFIPIAEESGLIQKLDTVVLRQACEFVKRLGKTASGQTPFVNVNLSAEHFSHAALPEVVKRVLTDVGVSGSALKLEVTESALLENAELAVNVMEELRTQGVRFGLDDFGTGYSSLSYLHRFPFESLKIDRSFIHACGSQEKRPELAAAIVLLARSMSLVTVAEGVETMTQLDFLRPLQCSYAQGFLFSPAVPADAAAQLFATQPFLT